MDILPNIVALCGSLDLVKPRPLLGGRTQYHALPLGGMTAVKSLTEELLVLERHLGVAVNP